MAISFNHLPPNVRVPLFYAEVDPSRAATYQADQRALLIGQMLSTGTATAEVPVLVTRPEQAAQLFGAGSMLHHMMLTYRLNDSFGEVWALPLADDGAGQAATGGFVVAGTATAAGTLERSIGGRSYRVPVQVGDAAADIAADFAAAVAADAAAHVTASANAGTVTLTARHKGTLANGLATVAPPPPGVDPAGLAITEATLANGTADPSIATGLAALGDEEFDYVALPYTDTVNLDLVATEWGDATGRWSWARQIYGHVFSARYGTVGQLASFGNARNDPHVSVLGLPPIPTPVWQTAAALTAVAARHLRVDPARPLQSLTLEGVIAPGPAASFILTERQTLAFDGIAIAGRTRDGRVRLDRVVTTYQLNAWDDPDPSYLDVTTLATLTLILRRLRQRITSRFPRHKLASDGTAFGAGQAIVTPSIARGEILAEYEALLTLGLVENIDAFDAALIVERNADDPNRLDVLFPPDLVNQLRVFAVLAQFRLQYEATAAA